MMLNNILKQLGKILKQCISWGLFSVISKCTFGTLVNIYGSRTVYVRLSQNKLHVPYMLPNAVV